MLSRMLFLALATISALGQTPTSGSDGQIRSVRQELDLAFQRHDAKQVAALATSDCDFIAPSIHVDGSDALKRLNESLFLKRTDVMLAHHANRIVVNEEWDVASEQGDWIERWTEKDGLTELRGTYLALWKRDGGKWREYSETIVPETCNGSSYCHQK